MRVEAEQVGRRFGRMVALSKVAFDLASGTRAALVGPNGAGKTTLARILLGMLECSGRVRLDGLSPTRDRSLVASKMAYVPQVAPGVAATAGELVRAVAALRRIRVDEIVQLADRFELDVSAIARKSFRALSGGMKQKLLLAMALSAPVDLLILDEPTASLDVRGRGVLFQMIEELPAQPTLILSSHRLEEIRRLVDQVIALDDGELIYQGGVSSYLASAAECVIEALPANGDASALAALGFEPAAGGWWRRVVPQGEKIATVERLLAAAAVTDLQVHEPERLDPAASPPPHEEAHEDA